MNWQDKLIIWRVTRDINTAQPNYPVYIQEEAQELLDATTTEEIIDALCDITVLTENQAKLEGHIIDYVIRAEEIDIIPAELNEGILYFLKFYNGVDGYNLISFQLLFTACATAIEELGYDFDKCMHETLKEISSRTGSMNEETGKWEKFTTAEAKASWYKADYSTCKK
jgi:hypothetical protein